MLFVGRRGGRGLAFFAEAVAFAAEVDDRAAVEQTVERGAGHHGVAGEDLAPVAEGLVAGQTDRLVPLMALADHLEQETCLDRLEGQITDLVDDQQLGLHQRVHLAVQGVAVDRAGQLDRQFNRRGEVNPVPQFGRQHAQRDGQMGLAQPRGAEQDHVAALGEEAASGQLVEQPPVDCQ